MAGDLVIGEGDFEAPRDHTRDLSGRLQSVTVVAADDYISSRVSGSEFTGQECGVGDTIDEAVTALAHDLSDFSQSVDDSTNEYVVTEDDAAASFQQVRHDGPTMMVDDLLRMREEQ